MKIFNWVHKRLHQRVVKDVFAGNEKKSELETNDKDTQAFLKQVGLVNVDGLDGWSDGILTIGTFGFDPLKSFTHQNEYFVLDSEEDDQESHGFSHSGNDDDDDDEHYDHSVEDEELNPLMFTTFEHSFKDIGSNFDAIVEKPGDVILTVDGVLVEKPGDVILTVDGVPVTPVKRSSEISTQPDQSANDQSKNKKGQRITLADLFQADVPDVGQLKLDSCKVQPEMEKKMNARTRSGLAFAKKLIPRVKDDSSPIKNMQRLMRRMLKRKIHPAELEDKIHKSDGQKQPSAVELISKVENDASDSVSLLPNQGAPCVH